MAGVERQEPIIAPLQTTALDLLVPVGERVAKAWVAGQPPCSAASEEGSCKRVDAAPNVLRAILSTGEQRWEFWQSWRRSSF